ncbi:triose-phosphate isomerase [Crocinitomicaceae bacterium]|nr:triose-phosphate isomerase [Crocinitomicaceae bacterium]
MAQKIVAGNWKMNLGKEEKMELLKGLKLSNIPSDVNAIVFPTSLYISDLAKSLTKIEVGVQNFSDQNNGAFTGEISISQIKSVGATIGLIGHSERRAYYQENNAFLKSKVDHAIKEQFKFIFCCGEPLSIRESGQEFLFVKNQLQESLFHLSAEEMMNGIVAYEPVWAIGTGVTATSEQAEDMHKSIRSWIEEKYTVEVANSVSILYGGSCKPSNAKELFACPNVDGGLIGGASLNASDFHAIINSF